ncbi:dipeptide/oligopeptide/nickel ABC transporter permease/ATP-binding protein [Spirillospora sp. NPDC049024]
MRSRRGGLPALLLTPGALIGVAGTLALTLVAAIAPFLLGHQATAVDTDHLLAGVSLRHPLGTDNLGRDVFSRLLVATRTSLLLALVAALSGAAAGVLLGALSTLLGRRFLRFFSSVLDIWLSFPDLLLVMFLSVVLGVGGTGAVVAVAIAFAPSFARLAQTLSASVTSRDYVAAARILGLSRRSILFRHVLPNIAEPLILNTTFAIGGALLFLSGMSFLGLGVQPPAYDWGQMLSQGLDDIYESPLAALGPGIAIILAGIVINFVGETFATVASGRWRTHPRHKARTSDVGTRLPVKAPASARIADEGVLLSASGLRVDLGTGEAAVTAVTAFDIKISQGEFVGIVGESGSGKSMSAMALAGLAPPNARVHAEHLTFKGTDPRSLSPAARRRMYATSLGMIFQDPMSSLNPLLRIGTQLAEAPRIHHGTRRRAAWSLAAERLAAVRIPGASRRLRERPDQFSGGMRQRVMIAMSMMCDPELIIADEPTTALDVTTQRQIIDLLKNVNERDGVAVVLISHDIGLILDVCTRVLVMYAGRVVEELSVSKGSAQARHPYTHALLAAVPTMSTDRRRPLATIAGRPLSADGAAGGCPFAPRCPRSDDLCTTTEPVLAESDQGARVACWHPHEDAPATRISERS